MAINNTIPCQEWLRELRETLSYNPETGVFTWLKWRGAHAKAGSEAGATDSKGHRQIRFKMRLYLAHRLAWVMTHGRWPDREIDHINRNRSDNRLSNLRECSHRENSANRSMYKNNKSGVLGVCYYPKYQKWVAYIRADGRHKSLGYFDSLEDAEKARKDAEATFYGKFAPSNAA
jgi:hypothetical protein